MDFESINKDFNKNKQTEAKLAGVKAKIEQFKQDIEEAKANIQIFAAEKNRAVIKKDDLAKDYAQQLIDNENKKMEALKKQLAKMEEVVKKTKEKVDGCIEKLSEDPEFKKHVDIAMQKKLLRRSKKALKENQMLGELKMLLDKHPNIKNNIVGMKNASIETKKLEDELSKLDKVTDAARISQIKIDLQNLAQKYSKNEQMILSYANKDNINISKDSLKLFIGDTSFKTDRKSGEWLIESTINHKIKGNIKTIKNDEIALSKITGKEIKIALENEGTDPSKESNVIVQSKDNLPAKKENLKWYQFVKRFKNWRQNIKNKVEKSTDISAQDYEDQLQENTSNKFKNAYKYDVVQEYARRNEKELVKQAKTVRRDQGR